jgi:gamma-glutamyl phosphate reductase
MLDCLDVNSKQSKNQCFAQMKRAIQKDLFKLIKACSFDFVKTKAVAITNSVLNYFEIQKSRYLC